MSDYRTNAKLPNYPQPHFWRYVWQQMLYRTLILIAAGAAIKIGFVIATQLTKLDKSPSPPSCTCPEQDGQKTREVVIAPSGHYLYTWDECLQKLPRYGDPNFFTCCTQARSYDKIDRRIGFPGTRAETLKCEKYDAAEPIKQKK